MGIIPWMLHPTSCQQAKTDINTNFPEGKMQSTNLNSSNLEVRVYPPGMKKLAKKLFAVHDADDTYDMNGDNYARPSTPYKIDLPFHDSEPNTTQVSGQNSLALPMPSFERKSEFLHDTCEVQSKPSSGLIFNNDYSKRTTVPRNTNISPQDSCQLLHENEVQDTVGGRGEPTRVPYASQISIGLEDTGSSHAESHASMKKENHNGRRKSPSSKNLKRPQHQIVKFLEDYTEFGADLKEIFEGRGKYCPTVLESTVDGSIVKGARRPHGSRKKSSLDTAIQSIGSHQDSLISLDKCGLKTEQHKYKCSVCEVTSRSRLDVEKHITAMGTPHSEAVVLVLLGSQAKGQNCPICNIRFTRLQLFQHIRSTHKDSFPLRCGYCVFFGQDYYQLRHHIRKKHGTSRYHIIDMSRLLAGEKATGEEPERKNLMCPLCRKSLKTLSNLKKHITQHSRKKQQCSHCSFVTTLPTQIRSHYRRKHPSQTPHWQTIILDKGGNNFLVEDVAPYLKLITEKYGILQPKEKGKWMRQYRCPHCQYTCNFNSSYNRHLHLHNGVKPYKCGYCDFHAREKYLIKKHCFIVHKGSKPLIEVDKNFKAPYRYEAKSREEQDESNGYLHNEEVANLQKIQKSTPREPQKPNHTSTSAPQTNKDILCKKPIQVDESLSEYENCSHESSKKHKSQNNEALFRFQLSNSLNPSPSVNIPMNKKDSVPEKAKYSRMNKNQVTSPVKHSRLYITAQDVYPKEIHEMGMTKQDEITHSNSVKDEQSQRNISSADDYKSSSLVHSQLEVKSSKNKKLPNESKTLLHISDKQYKEVSHNLHSEVQKNGSLSMYTQVSTINKQEGIVSDSILMEPSAEMEEEMLVIYLKENKYGDLLVGKTEKIYNCCRTANKHYTNNEANKDPDHIKAKSSAADQETMLTHDSTRHDKFDHSHLHVCQVNLRKQAGNALPYSSREILSCGMESNLHSHINYLSDLQVQRPSNHIPATPGTQKCEQLNGNYTNSDYYSIDKVRLMMQKENGRVRCRKCGVTTTYRAFYKHAKKHFNLKPFKCGYCSYRSIEKSKVKVHNTFCHPNLPPVILKLSPESAGIDCNGPSDSEVKSKEKSKSREMMEVYNTVEGKKLHREGHKNISQSSSIISSQNGEACSSTSQSVFQCPLCSKCLQKHTPSIRRHLYRHYGYKPYKCSYCCYMGTGQSEIRAHHVTHGFNTPPKVEDSGLPMPPDLSLHINNTFPFLRGTQQNPKRKKHVLQDVVHGDGTQSFQESSGQKESSDAIRDITTIHLSSQNNSEENLMFSNDSKSLKSCDSTTCSVPQTPNCDSPVPESAYRVQVLEQGNTTTLSKLSSPLKPESVCVVYLID